jgi:hypothetical protein
MIQSIKELPPQIQEKAQFTDRYLQTVMSALIPFLHESGFDEPFAQTFFLAEADANVQGITRQEKWHLHWFFPINQFDNGKLVTDENISRWFLNDYSTKTNSLLSYHLETRLLIEKIGNHDVCAPNGKPTARWHLAGNSQWSNPGLGESVEKFMLHSTQNLCSLNRQQFAKLALACHQTLRENSILHRADRLHYMVPFSTE